MKIENDIITERLVIRSMTQEDALFVWSIWGDKEMGKYLSDPYYESPEVLYEQFADIENWKDYAFVAFRRDNGQFVGTISLGPEEGDIWGFGYTVHKKFWGQGYATEMLKAAIDFAVGLGVRDFMAGHAVENKASCRVMEKCGLKYHHDSSFKKSGTDMVYSSHIHVLHVEE